MTQQDTSTPTNTQPSPADLWEREGAKRALDDLFGNAARYKSSPDFMEMMRFVVRFPVYSPFNAMLVHIQMKGARYVAPAHRWAKSYRRCIKPGARPLVILQPMGPVMFVFDVADTEPLSDAPPLPREIENPFEVLGGLIGEELDRTIRNAGRDGIAIEEVQEGSQFAGSIQISQPGREIPFLVKERPQEEYIMVPRRYQLLLNKSHSAESRYATLVHELGHLYAGHLGTPTPRWWPDRRGLSEAAREFEAESICYLVCGRLGISNPSDQYLAGHMGKNNEVPNISLDCVMKAAGLIEQMARERLPPRKSA